MGSRDFFVPFRLDSHVLYGAQQTYFSRIALLRGFPSRKGSVSAHAEAVAPSSHTLGSFSPTADTLLSLVSTLCFFCVSVSGEDLHAISGNNAAASSGGGRNVFAFSSVCSASNANFSSLSTEFKSVLRTITCRCAHRLRCS